MIQPCDLNFDEAVDGCSAQTYGVALAGLATAYARISDPRGLPHPTADVPKRLRSAAATHPALVGGTASRFDPALMSATGGGLLAEWVAEGVLVVAIQGGRCGLALKIDDGSSRPHPWVVLGLLERMKLIQTDELRTLQSWYSSTLVTALGARTGRLLVRDDLDFEE